MSCTLLGVVHEGRLGDNAAGVRRYVRVFKVSSTQIDELPENVKLAAGLPVVNDYYTSAEGDDKGAIAESVNAAIGNSPYLWLVTVEYTSKGTNWSEWSDNPLQRRWRPRIRTEKFKKPAQRDKNGVARENSAGDLLEGQEIDDSRVVIEYEINVADDYLAQVIVPSKDGVNIAAWMDYDAKTLKVDDITTEPGFEGSLVESVPFNHVNLRFHHNPDTWVTKTYDRGWHFTDGGFKLRFRDKRGTPTPDPQFLDGQGNPLSEATTTLNGGIANNAVTLTATDGSVFPAISTTGTVRYFYIQIGTEIIKCTAHTSGSATLTIERGVNGSTAAAHTNGDTITLLPVELNFDDYQLIDYSLFDVPG